ncbi:hypothetical protein [Candidatus Neptunichlamydia sp. REUL1]|uniref:hypothetical protein n=1 Tax=Candidatus Neptunichlamydia sp. REUL1 TaxID=3064277 RepID=UPI00292DB018|nr:hypothetical protein [Candidatus Neptunochlamydia sp. REUL1]
MIKRTTIIAFFILVLFTGGVLFQGFYSFKEGGSIEEMLTQEISMPKHEEKFPNKQMRKGVAKDLWISDKDHVRLHHRIESPRSILTAIPHGNRVELIEQMIGMKCFFQERLEKEEGEPMQQIRYLQSGEGTYRYTDHFFDAHSVFLALYRMPGESLVTHLDADDAYLKGIAEEVSLSFSNGTPNFHAEKFKAQIRPQGKIP